MSPRQPPPVSVSVDERRRFEARRDATTLQLLFRAARLANEHALARVGSAPNGARLRAAHATLLPHLNFEGLRLTELAAKVGTSKQAVGQLVDELASMGMVERVADPHDRRAKLIRFSHRGHAALMHGLGVLHQLETALSSRVGQSRMRQLARTLTLVVDVLATSESLPSLRAADNQPK